MALLQIAQTIAESVNVRRPTSVVGNADIDTRQIYKAIKQECKYLVSAAYWQEIRAEQTFTAIAGETQTGILPSDFDRMVPETFWDRSNTRNIANVSSAVEWQNLKAINYLGPEKKFIIRGGVLSILPAMAGGETLAFEYVSTNFCESSGGTAQSAWAADTDVARLDEDLIALGGIWRYLQDVKQPYAKDEAIYKERLNQLLANDSPASGTMLSADIFGGGRAFGGAPSASGYLGTTF